MAMRNTVDAKKMRDEYLERVENLYAKARKWIDGFAPKAEVSQEVTTLHEEPVEPYSANVLKIERPDYKTVHLIPRGRWIIGAEGRVDMKSSLGTETLVYVSDGGDSIKIDSLTENGKVLKEEGPEYNAKDVAEGWVFIQNRRLGMLPSLDADLFHRLLEVLGR